MKARAYLSYDADAVSMETGLACPEPTLTVQSTRDEVDINTIVDRFGITGAIPTDVRVPQYEDFADVFDFRSAIEAIAMAEDSFMSMPAKVRAEFSNDAQQFLEFCSKPENLPRMRELGLAVPEKPAEPEKIQKVEVVNREAPKA